MAQTTTPSTNPRVVARVANQTPERRSEISKKAAEARWAKRPAKKTPEHMLAMAPTGGIKTMSSLEIAELLKSNHSDVKRSITRLTERGVISLPPMAQVKIMRERREEAIEAYQLEKRDSIVVVAQLSPEFTGALVDRWAALEFAHYHKPSLTAEDHVTALIAMNKEKYGILERGAFIPSAEEYGKLANNGLPKLGIRKGSYVAGSSKVELALQLQATGNQLHWLDAFFTA